MSDDRNSAIRVPPSGTPGPVGGTGGGGSVLDRAAAGLHPAYFALVMATGIVSLAAWIQGSAVIARGLFWLNVVFFAALRAVCARVAVPAPTLVALAITAILVALFRGRFALVRGDRPISATRRAFELAYYTHWCAAVGATLVFIASGALALAALTGRPFKLVNVRANRPKPGLQPQHLNMPAHLFRQIQLLLGCQWGVCRNKKAGQHVCLF